MKKHGILNSHISKVLSDMGHKDTLVIADCGLPIPAGVEKIDLALKAGDPSFSEVLQEVLEDFVVEKAILANEIKDHNSAGYQGVLPLLGIIPVDYVPHEELKHMTHKAKAVIRTGEATPFSNVILQAGVAF
jgi:D-ribose pyranase